MAPHIPRRLFLASAALAVATLSFAGSAAWPQLARSSASGHTCGGKRVTIMGTPGDDTIVGKGANDVIYGGGGNDHISGGRNGNDTICGGAGDDTIEGGRGYDSLFGEEGDDRLLGGKGSDKLRGGDGNDVMIGFKGADDLDGGAGDDYGNGERGSDSLEGGDGNDRLIGDKGNDRITGGAGDDTIEGGAGDDGVLAGGDGADVILGGAGIDNADGGPGNGDVVRGDSGTDVLSGGPGANDIVSFVSATQRGVQINLATGSAEGDGPDSLAGFEDVVGSSGDDTLSGDGQANRIDGGVGDDTLQGGGGNDEAFGGPGTDACKAFAVESSCGPERGPPAGEAGVILNQGLDGASLVIQGSSAADRMLISFDGGAWKVDDDVRVFAGEGCANADATVASCAGAPNLSLIVLTGGAGDDALTVDHSVPASVSVRANGGAGDDTIEGGAGEDLLEAGDTFGNSTSGNDKLIGGGGGDVLFADSGSDQLEGGDGNDLLVSSPAVCQGHTFDGGPGSDTVSYAHSNAALRVALNGTGGPVGCGNPDRVLADNESLEGSDGPDVLIGDNGPNGMLGHTGADTFIGKGGHDFIDAFDGQRDKRIDCGPGVDEVRKDRNDPRPISC